MKTLAPFIQLDPSENSRPLYRQIYDSIRDSILSGEFQSRMRLPATRLLADQLGVSRMTVINAYDQLFAEGYLEGKTGSGTFVAAQLPEEFFKTPRDAAAEGNTPGTTRRIPLSDYGRFVTAHLPALLRDHGATRYVPFQHGLGAIDEFPFEIWSKIASRYLKYAKPDSLGYGDPAGYLPLRSAVAAHLRSSRGVRCEDEQVIITGGAQNAIDLIGRLLLGPRDKVWLEDPGYLGARDVFDSFGAKVIPVPLDAEGMDIRNALKKPDARLAYVTPSSQFPTGVTMSLSRRMRLLEWARNHDAWIISEGHFERHLRRMRTLYKTRQHVLVNEIRKRLDGAIDITEADAGMHRVGWLPEGVNDKTVSQRASELALRVAAVSNYSINSTFRSGLLLGYTAFNEKQIKEGVRKLEKVMAEYV
jgi:GntR family transcriptional regulator/MocR family aminotransferase